MKYFFCTRAVTTKAVAVLTLFTLFTFTVFPIAHAQAVPDSTAPDTTTITADTPVLDVPVDTISGVDTPVENDTSTEAKTDTQTDATSDTTKDTVDTITDPTIDSKPDVQALKTLVPQMPTITMPAVDVLDTDTGSISVCKVVLQADGSLATGTSGDTYSIAVTDNTGAAVGTASFVAPLVYDTDVMSDISGNDATCQTFSALSLNATGTTTFTFKPETTNNDSMWQAPRYAVLDAGATIASTDATLGAYDTGAIDLALPTETTAHANEKVLVVVNQLKPTTQPVENSCMLPDALGDDSNNTIHDSREKTVQKILTDNGYTINADTDQQQYQLWHVVAGQTVSVDATFLDNYAGHGNVFGYYTNDDINTFKPLFKRGESSDYPSVPTATAGNSYSFTVPDGATTLGFAIKSYDGSLVGTIATEHHLNDGQADNVVVYNPQSNTYVLGFEDLVSGSDYDYNDIVVSIHIDCSDTGNNGGGGDDNGGGTVMECADGADNDGDNLIDAADPGCHTDGDASNSASYDSNDNDETDNYGTGGGSLQCVDGIDNDGDGLIDEADPGCHTDGNANNSASYDPTDDDETNSTVGGGSVSHRSSSSSSPSSDEGQVLGASTCTEYLHSYIKLGKENNIDDVTRLQQFLNDYLGLSLPLTGTYDLLTYNAVKEFQVKEKTQVLVPWVGVTLPTADRGTGWVYKTTKRWINMIKCPELNIPMPELTIDPQDL